MQNEIVNKVSQSPLVTLDLEDFLPELDCVSWDMKDILFKGLILKEKEFRLFVKEHNWDKYKNKYVNIHCSTDAIIPTWAYMILANKLCMAGAKTYCGSYEMMELEVYSEIINTMDFELYKDKMIVLKGCGSRKITNSYYVKFTAKLSPIVKSIMYGEPCSTVPVYKKPK